LKILVTAKRVIDPYSKPSLKSDGTIADDDLEFKMNPFCEIAVEAALQLKDEDDAEVVVVAIGEDEATKEIRTALAMGADRGILVELDEAKLDSDLTARILHKIVQNEKPDLVILGKQAVDGDSNQVAQLLAEFLGWPQATFAYKIALSDGQATVQREVDGGVETVALTLPAVITTDLRLNEPRYASLPGIIKAKKKPIDRYTPADLGVDVTSKVRAVFFETPPTRSAGQMVANVDALIAKLRDEAKVI
jgi:electron transfer flavoprotein beta subunit